MNMRYRRLWVKISKIT